MTTTTFSALGNVDCIIAVREGALNSRLSRDFCTSGRFDTSKRAIKASDGYSLSGWPSLQVIHLDTNGVLRSAYFEYALAGTAEDPGQIQYYPMFGNAARLVTASFTRLTYTFLVPIKAVQLDKASLASAKFLPPALLAQLSAPDFDWNALVPTVYMLDLDPANLAGYVANYDPARSRIEGFQPTAVDGGGALPPNTDPLARGTSKTAPLKQVQNLVVQDLQAQPWAAGANPFVLGIALVSRKANTPEDFTQVAFSTWDDATDNRNNAFQVLLNQTRPIASTDGQLQQPLIAPKTPPEVQGVLALSSNQFYLMVIKPLLDEVAQTLKVPSNWTPSGTYANSYALNVTQASSGKGVQIDSTAGIDTYATYTSITKCIVSVSCTSDDPAANRAVEIKGTGSLNFSAEIDTYPIGAMQVKDATYSSKVDSFTFSLTLTPGPNGKLASSFTGPGKITPTPSQWVNPMAKVGDPLMHFFNIKTFSDYVTSQATALSDLQRGELKRFGDNLASFLDAQQKRIMLSDGGELFFKNLWLTQYGDVLSELRWKSTNKGA